MAETTRRGLARRYDQTDAGFAPDVRRQAALQAVLGDRAPVSVRNDHVAEDER